MRACGVRERVVVGGLTERCEAMIEYAGVLAEVGRRGLGSVRRWEVEGRSKEKAKDGGGMCVLILCKMSTDD